MQLVDVIKRIVPALVGCLLVQGASAAVIGNANIANVAGGGLTLTSTAVDFLLPPGGGSGAMATGTGTNVVYAGGGPLASGSAGVIKDIPGAGAILDFMTFATDPNLHFDLVSMGPGVANTVAVNVFDPNTPASSPFAGSPYILQSTATGTTLTFTVNGIARDLSSPDSLWSGVFTTQFSGVTPLQVQTALLNQQSISSTYSASITATGFIPEPGTVSLLLMGLIPLARRRRN